MTTLKVHLDNDAQQEALKVILDGFKIPYETEPSTDATAYLTSTEANRKWLDTAMLEAENGEGKEIKIDDLWK